MQRHSLGSLQTADPIDREHFSIKSHLANRSFAVLPPRFTIDVGHIQNATRAIEENRARVVPAWLTRNDEALKGTVTRLPTRDEMEPSINEQLIVEYYSRF